MSRNRIQKIPINRTVIPIDPSGMERNIPAAMDGQQQEQGLPVAIYDASNVMPTAQGYSSFFGKRYVCDGNLPPNQEYVFVYEDPQGNIYMLALGDTGIYNQGADCDTAEELIQGDGFEVTDYGD